MKIHIPNPKTHSKILWHFTGGPLWNDQKGCQEKTPKPESGAYDILKKILKSKELRVGRYHELIKVLVKEERYYDLQAKEVKTRKNQIKEVKTSPVCCVADIPISELYFHAQRYGRFAIGFHREALMKNGFNPVFYAPVNGEIIANFYQAQRSLSLMDQSGITDAAEALKDQVEGQVADLELEDEGVDVDISDIELEADMLTSEAESALEHLGESLAFVKTHDSNDFEYIYAEREWRSTEPFKFIAEDIAIILVPSTERDYLSDLTGKDFASIDLPRTVSIARWEDVVG